VKLADFDYELPEELIAQAPADRRDQSRLLAVGQDPEDRRFADVVDLVPEGAVVIANDSRVRPARLHLRKADSGGAVEITLVELINRRRWRAVARASKPIRAGAELVAGDGTSLIVAAGRDPHGLIEIVLPEDAERLCGRLGELPLPPYIRREPTRADASRYQTVFAERPGSVAAPTAGLHITPELIGRIEATGRIWAPITLEVGLGTFAPIRGDDLDGHRMHSERYAISERVAALAGGERPVVAVGTTVVRALESAFDPATGAVRSGARSTELFIRPGFAFRVVNVLITNFHLPRSTLLMLVSAFAGRERVLAAYHRAVERGYRFYSYGDAMLLERSDD
jgi:S-adenosylmethionine:tRNA ribosyltransferase-isomerase